MASPTDRPREPIESMETLVSCVEDELRFVLSKAVDEERNEGRIKPAWGTIIMHALRAVHIPNLSPKEAVEKAMSLVFGERMEISADDVDKNIYVVHCTSMKEKGTVDDLPDIWELSLGKIEHTDPALDYLEKSFQRTINYGRRLPGSLLLDADTLDRPFTEDFVPNAVKIAMVRGTSKALEKLRAARTIANKPSYVICWGAGKSDPGRMESFAGSGRLYVPQKDARFFLIQIEPGKKVRGEIKHLIAQTSDRTLSVLLQNEL